MNIPGDVEVFIVLVDGERWTETTSFASAASGDRVYVLDPTGTVVFGDGVHGQQPKSSAAVTVSFRQGGGEASNVQVSVTTRCPPRTCRALVEVDPHGVHIHEINRGVEHSSGEKLVRYFSGQVLSASDLDAEQQYHQTHVGLTTCASKPDP